MRHLLAYCGSASYLPSLSRSLDEQSKRPHGLDRIWVTDANYGPLPTLFCDAFVDGQYCLSISRNAALDYALENEYDWISLVDVDCLVWQSPSWYPRSGFSRLRALRQQPEEAVDMDYSRSRLFRWEPSGWVLLGREHIKTRRFHTAYVGYGHEETDFIDVVMKDVVPWPTDMKTVHLYHPKRNHHNSDDRNRNVLIGRLKK